LDEEIEIGNLADD